mmetsp:Transcript_47047/g.110862  ORF Transcript_47047/g.110862 Transcript_47047/m.110862 type:complete len:378 (-) Transcript_47047:93-1226(-)
MEARGKHFSPCDLSPVDGLNVTIRDSAVGGMGFDVEWRDVRCLPSSSDADVSRNATPRAFTEGARNVANLLKVLQRITFGEEPQDVKAGAAGGAAAGGARESRGEEVKGLYLQQRSTRANMQRVTIATDANGDLKEAIFYEGTTIVGRDSDSRGFLRRLSQLCSGEEGWQLVRPVAWCELPSELWWHVLRCMTAREGRAVACTSSMIRNITTLESFVWAPAQLHLALVSAQEAVRSDTSTHLPLNIADNEVRIGRSRRNDVVLLRDPEVSKKHCRLWRDARGDVYIQDLASTNGTKLNGDWLRPQREVGDRTYSQPRKLVVGDSVVLGLTTLALHDGPCPPQPAAEGNADSREDGDSSAGGEGGEGGSPEGRQGDRD